LNRLVQEKGRDIFRIKGILNVDAEDRRFVFQGVHMLLDGRPGRPWQSGESRRNEIVFIDFEKRVFVEPWETRIFGIHVAMMALSQHLKESIPKYPIDQVPTKFKSTWTWADLRKGAEAMHPFDYFKYRYYEKWLGGISGFFVSQGYISQEELDAKTSAYLKGKGSIPQSRNELIDNQIIEYLRTGDPGGREVAGAPKFRKNDTIRVKNIPPSDHTRLPGHLRGKTGVVDKIYSGFYMYFCSTGPDGLGEPKRSSLFSLRKEL
jgi:nitrile hydratase subunit beta